jgi:hypothetical protein
MEKRTIDSYVSVVSHYESAAVAQPRKCAFDFPSTSESSQRSAILRRLFASSLAMRADKFYATLSKTLSQWVRVVTAIRDKTLGFAFGCTRSVPRHCYFLERLFDELDFRRGRRVQVVSQRNTFAVDHHHPLRSFAFLGLSDAFAPFLAGAKLPSRKHSLQSSWPRSSNSPRNALQIVSHISCSSQSCSRRQQVEPLPYCFGKSAHGAPVRSIQRMPSNTLRLSSHGLPPRFDFLSFGNNDSILAHCSSVSFQRFFDRFFAIERLLSIAMCHTIVDGASIKCSIF